MAVASDCGIRSRCRATCTPTPPPQSRATAMPNAPRSVRIACLSTTPRTRDEHARCRQPVEPVRPAPGIDSPTDGDATPAFSPASRRHGHPGTRRRTWRFRVDPPGEYSGCVCVLNTSSRARRRHLAGEPGTLPAGPLPARPTQRVQRVSSPGNCTGAGPRHPATKIHMAATRLAPHAYPFCAVADRATDSPYAFLDIAHGYLPALRLQASGRR